MDYRGNDQIAYIIRKLGASPNSRRAVAVLWDPLIDQEQPHGPCLNFISFNIHNDELFASIVFRSHDLFKAWPKNVLGLMRLQRHVVDRINERHGMRLKPGRFTVISISAHIYEQDFADAKAVVDQHLSIIQRLNVDPKGLFVVDIETGTIRVEYRSNAGELLQVFEGKNGEDLYQQIANNDIFSFFVHSAYLGYQISKAESCLNDGRPYVQDAAPDS
ncbi:hypothetical protein COY28_03070 [Candidatus Woesearchaeota archaeon CG_4_10_14_0_2_um_filter_57_5]|nr:MAG: hypothetical protein COY28_03070 [Candidatus Woesearchaeota archaeon CG_4_10_14_0_2_um_filter_57_5]